MLRAMLSPAGRWTSPTSAGPRRGRSSAGSRTPPSSSAARRRAKDALAAAVATGTAAALAPFGVRPPSAEPRRATGAGGAGGRARGAARRGPARVAGRRSSCSRAPARRPTRRAEDGRRARRPGARGGFRQRLRRRAGAAAPPRRREPDLWADAVGPAGVTARAGADIRPWLARAGTLRDATSAYGETLLVREAFGRRPLLRVVQTPGGRLRHLGRPAVPRRRARRWCRSRAWSLERGSARRRPELAGGRRASCSTSGPRSSRGA